MLQLLKIEWMKLKSYRAFWILSILYFISVIGASLIGWSMEQRAIAKEKGLKALGTSFDYPDLWQTVSWMSSLLLFMPALLIILSVSNEYVYKTHRQNIIDGWSRSQFISVKIMMIILLSILSVIMVVITVFIVGTLGEAPFSWDGIKYIGYFFIQALTYGSLSLLLSVLIKRTGLALGIFLLYAFVIEGLISTLMKVLTKSSSGSYLPLNASDDLIPFPFIKNATKMIIDKPNPTLLFVFAGLYLFIYLFISVRRFQRSDL